jgi:hypothetical protein
MPHEVSFGGDDSKIINSIIVGNTGREGAGIYCLIKLMENPKN